MKRSTVIVDIDGCIFIHQNEGCLSQWNSSMSLCPNVLSQFQDWEAQSAVIILMTARPECLRAELEALLRSFGLFWDHLIMGVGHGVRVLYNDVKPNGLPSAVAVNLPRNQGFPK